MTYFVVVQLVYECDESPRDVSGLPAGDTCNQAFMRSSCSAFNHWYMEAAERVDTATAE
jgi:hypothetical protein